MVFGDQINRQKSLGQATMNVRHMLTTFIDSVTPSMHASRRASLQSCVLSCAHKNHLSITSIGRGIERDSFEKHRIKQADRLLSNTQLHQELPDIYKHITQQLLNEIAQPVLLVDWSDMDPYQKHFLLRAALVCQGRSLTIYEEVHPLKKKDKPCTHRQFLRALKDIMPISCKPVLVTDAGFRCPWFRQVLEMGWDYVGRVRHQTQYITEAGDWEPCKSLHANASGKAIWLNKVTLAKSQPFFTNALVLYKNAAKGRHARNRNGQRKCGHSSLKAAEGWKEPWLLTTSLPVETEEQANAIIKRYGARMQIEESFRDQKSARFGLGMAMHHTHKTKRLTVLVLIGTLACIFLYLLGLLAKDAGLAKQYQANTESRRNVLSCVFIGVRILKTGVHYIEFENQFPITARLRQHTTEYAVRWAA